MSFTVPADLAVIIAPTHLAQEEFSVYLVNPSVAPAQEIPVAPSIAAHVSALKTSIAVKMFVAEAAAPKSGLASLSLA